MRGAAGVCSWNFLFLVYINDIAEHLLSLTRLFADDSSLFYSAAHIDDIAGIINHDMQLLSNWARQWLVYKYNILERVIVENIIPRNVIINRGAAEVDNQISRDDFSTITLSRMLYLFYYTEHYSLIFLPFFLQPWCGKFQGQHNVHLLRMDEMISFTKGLCL